MSRRLTPHHSLAKIQAAIRAGDYFVTRTALVGAAEIVMDEDDICECVASLEERDFYKSMPSKKRQGLFHDVYKRRFLGFAVYVKLQMTGSAVVISFNRDESA